MTREIGWREMGSPVAVLAGGKSRAETRLYARLEPSGFMSGVMPVIHHPLPAPAARPARSERRCGGGDPSADDEPMVLKWLASLASGETMRTPVGGGLTANERAVLARLESAVEDVVRAIPQMITAGKALAEIKAKQLYRDTAKTWAEYAENRFRMTARRADQLIAFAGVADMTAAVSEELGTAVPELSERACRPLVGLGDDEAREAIREAVAADGLTPKSIRTAVSRRRPKPSAPRPTRLRLPGGIVVVEINKRGLASGVDAESLLAAALDAIRRGRSEAA